MYIALIEKEPEMSNAEALHQLFAQCQKVNFDESYDIIASAQSPEEADFFRMATDLILKQKQKKLLTRIASNEVVNAQWTIQRID